MALFEEGGALAFFPLRDDGWLGGWRVSVFRLAVGVGGWVCGV